MSPMAELVLLVTEEQQLYVKQQLGPVPRLGTHWQFVIPAAAGLSRALLIAYHRADQRKATRTTLDRFNSRMAAPREPVDTRELRQLVISDRFLSSVLESAFDAVMMVDRSGNIVDFNPSAERLFQRTREQALSHPIWKIASGPWPEQIRSVIADPQHSDFLQTSIELESGVRHLEVSATRVYDPNRTIIATSLIVRDLTHRIQSENALRTNEKLAAVGRLASSIAHEINNPLDAVMNLVYLELIS